MTVIVKYSQEGKPQYQSAKGIGSTEAERTKARQLDELLRNELTSLKQRLIKAGLLRKNTKGNVELYWELGKVLRDVFFNSQLIDLSERHLFWMNAKMYVPEELLTKDRGPNRMHLEYCFRLAAFSKDKAGKLKWGEWVYLFDSSQRNREERFDQWLEEKFNDKSNQLTRDDIRILAQSMYGLLGNIETKDLSDEQLWRSYESAWFIKEIFRLKIKDLSNEDLKETLKAGIKKHKAQFGEVLDGNQEPEVFAALVATEIVSTQ